MNTKATRLTQISDYAVSLRNSCRK